MDEISIYNRALTAGEIQSIYNAGSAGKCPPPPGLWQRLPTAVLSYRSQPVWVNLCQPGSTAITGWTVGSMVGMGWQNGASSGVNPVDGAQHLGFNGGNASPGSSIFQTFATTVGQTYAVSFYVGRAGSGSGTMSLLAEVTSSAGAVLGSLSAVAPGSPGYGPVQTFTFTATTSNSTLNFQDTSSATIAVDLLLDNVSVAPSSPPPSVGPFTNGSFELPAQMTGLGRGVAAGIDSDYRMDGWQHLVGMRWQNGPLFLRPALTRLTGSSIWFQRRQQPVRGRPSSNVCHDSGPNLRGELLRGARRFRRRDDAFG